MRGRLGIRAAMQRYLKHVRMVNAHTAHRQGHLHRCTAGKSIRNEAFFTTTLFPTMFTQLHLPPSLSTRTHARTYERTFILHSESRTFQPADLLAQDALAWDVLASYYLKIGRFGLICFICYLINTTSSQEINTVTCTIVKTYTVKYTIRIPNHIQFRQLTRAYKQVNISHYIILCNYENHGEINFS